MSEEAAMRGPNYDWKLEADHYRVQCERLQELLGKVESSWEREAHSLESEVARLRGLLERTKYAIEDAVFRISKGAPQDLERLAILCADLEKGAG